MMARRRRMIVVVLVGLALLVAFAVMPLPGRAQTGRGGRGGNTTANNRVIDNERVTVQRLTTAPGTPAKPHVHQDEDFVTIQITPGELEVRVGNEVTQGAVGKAWWLPKKVAHAVSNRGKEPVDVIAITIK